MRRIWIGLLAIFATLAQGCVFSNGFDRGCVMIFGGFGNTYSSYTIGGTAAGAAFLSDTEELGDGQPSTVTRCQWIGGAQTTASATRIGLTVNTPDGSNPLVGVVAVLNVTGLPEHLPVYAYDAATFPAPGSLIGASTLEYGNNGVLQAWITPNSNFNATTNAIYVQFLNNISASAPVAANAEFTVGEIFVGQAIEWPLKRDPTLGYATGPKVRLSAAGVQWPIPQPSVRTLQINLAPITQKDAVALPPPAFDVATMVNAIMNSNVVAVMPWLTFDVAYYGTIGDKSDAKITAKTAFLAQLIQPMPTIKGDNDMYYDVSMMFQESI